MSAAAAADHREHFCLRSQAAVWSQQNAVPAGIAGLGRVDNNWPLTIPWTSLAVTALVVPIVAALAAGLFTRSRLPLVRRLAA